jgi:hypothetical protein
VAGSTAAISPPLARGHGAGEIWWKTTLIGGPRLVATVEAGQREKMAFSNF